MHHSQLLSCAEFPPRTQVNPRSERMGVAAMGLSGIGLFLAGVLAAGISRLASDDLVNDPVVAEAPCHLLPLPTIGCPSLMSEKGLVVVCIRCVDGIDRTGIPAPAVRTSVRSILIGQPWADGADPAGDVPQRRAPERRIF